jgi:hypothetical protein
MNVSIASGASVRRIAEIIRHATVFGPGSWEGQNLPGRDVNHGPPGDPNGQAIDRDVKALFALLKARDIAYLLVGGVAMLKYVEGRNTEDIDLLMSLPSLQRLPEIRVEDQQDFFVRGKFQTVRVDVLLTANPLFQTVQERFATTHRFLEAEVPCATPEGLIVLKLYALPSLYRQGDFERVKVYESDISSLLFRYRPDTQPLLELLNHHMPEGQITELRKIVQEKLEEIARFGQRNRF